MSEFINSPEERQAAIEHSINKRVKEQQESDLPLKEQYRQNVSILVVNQEGYMLIGQSPEEYKRDPENAGGLAQGGIEKGKTAKETVYDELNGEYSIQKADIDSITFLPVKDRAVQEYDDQRSKDELDKKPPRPGKGKEYYPTIVEIATEQPFNPYEKKVNPETGEVTYKREVQDYMWRTPEQAIEFFENMKVNEPNKADKAEMSLKMIRHYLNNIKK